MVSPVPSEGTRPRVAPIRLITCGCIGQPLESTLSSTDEPPVEANLTTPPRKVNNVVGVTVQVWSREAVGAVCVLKLTDCSGDSQRLAGLLASKRGKGQVV